MDHDLPPRGGTRLFVQRFCNIDPDKILMNIYYFVTSDSEHQQVNVPLFIDCRENSLSHIWLQ